MGWKDDIQAETKKERRMGRGTGNAKGKKERKHGP